MLTDEQINKESMEFIAKTFPAFTDWAHLVMNDLVSAKHWVHMRALAESKDQAETYKARAIRGIEDAMEKFRGVGV